MILKTMIFVVLIMLIYLFAMVLHFKSSGVSNFWGQALIQYAGLLLHSIPLLLVISSTLFFAFQITFDKLYAMRVIPVLAAINALLIIPFFVVNPKVDAFPEFPKLTLSADVEEGTIHPEDNLKVYINKMKGATIQNGLIFDKNVWFLDSGSISKSRLSVSGSRTMGNEGPYSRSYNISVSRNNKIDQLRDTGISYWLFTRYVKYIQHLKGVFENSFTVKKNLALSLLSIFVVCIGFFSLLAAASFFFNEKQVYFLSMSTLLIVGMVGFITLPYYLSTFEVLKFAIRNPLGKILVPSLLTTVLSLLISLGLVVMKDALMQKKGGRA